MKKKSSEEMNFPLEGIRVIDMSALLAGPSCGKYLADHGAEVIKIERYPIGDIARHSLNESGLGAMFCQHNTGKKGMCIDLKREEGIEIIKDLVHKSDILLEAFTPGVMVRLGLDYETLSEINPRLIMCSLSGFGQTGPNASRPGYAHISHAMTGWLAMQFLHRDPPEEPHGPGIAIGDTTAGLTAFGAICAALYRREKTGEGEQIDIAIFDALFCSNDMSLQHYLLTNTVQVWYHPVYKTKKGYLTANIGPDFRAWENICKAMERPELAKDERFDSQEKLMENREQATQLVTDWLTGLTAEEAEKRLTDHHVACAIVYTIDQAVRQPQVKARNLVSEVEDPLMGNIEVINSAFKYRRADCGVRGPAPMLGEHNEEILKRVLGYDRERIESLKEKGIIIQ